MKVKARRTGESQLDGEKIMFFYIDESGNTGNNLFDASQRRLSYGVLSSLTNPDARCGDTFSKIQKKIGSNSIHANHLGVGGLTKIVPELLHIQSRLKCDFDYYFIDKPAYALVSFFEAVFDAGLNPAVKWDLYWTPLRYLIIHKLSTILDEEVMRRSWTLCTTKKIEKKLSDVQQLLRDVHARVGSSTLDARSKEVISDALAYGISKPEALDFGIYDERIISPNAVGFQFVVSAVARRVRKKHLKRVNRIVVDRQTQFNRAQIEMHSLLSRFAEGMKTASQKDRKMYMANPMFATLDKDDLIHKDLPDTPVNVLESGASIGLQIVDVYLWIANRVIDGGELSPELMLLWQSFAGRSLIDGISMNGMAQRYQQFDRLMPRFDELTEEQHAKASEYVESHRAKVRSLNE